MLCHISSAFLEEQSTFAYKTPIPQQKCFLSDRWKSKLTTAIKQRQP